MNSPTAPGCALPAPRGDAQVHGGCSAPCLAEEPWACDFWDVRASDRGTPRAEAPSVPCGREGDGDTEGWQLRGER